MSRISRLLFLALPVTMAACGGSSSAGSPARATTATTLPASRAFHPPAASGFVAAIAAASSSMQVQSPSAGEVTVSWTPATRFIQTRAVGAGSLAVGDCVTAVGVAAGGASLAARSVSITPAPGSGSCLRDRSRGGLGGFGGFGGAGYPGRAGAPRGSAPARASFSIALGKVTAVTGGGFELSGYLRDAGGKPGAARGKVAGSQARSSTSSLPPTSEVAVTTSPATTYTETAPATSAALSVGACITAEGEVSSTGAVTAAVISVRPPVNGQCTGGFGTGAGSGSSGA